MRLLRLRLATYVQILAAILVAAAVMALVFAADRAQREAILAHGEAVLGDRVQAAGEVLRSGIQGLREDVLFLSLTPPMRGLMRADRHGGFDPRDGDTRAAWMRRLKEIFIAFANSHSDYVQIRYVGVADGGLEIARVVRRLGDVVVVPDGALARRGGDADLRAAQGLRKGEVHLSDWLADEESGGKGRRILRASVPVVDEAGQPYGVVTVDLDAGPLFDAVASRLPTDAEARLVDGEGHSLLGAGTSRPGFAQGDARSLIAAFPGLADLFDLRSSRHRPTYVEETGDDRRFVTAQRIHYDPRRPERFLVLAFTQPESAFAAELGSGRSGLILRGLAAALFLGALIQIALTWLFRPLRQIAEAADAVAEGGRDVVLPAKGSGEVGALARSFSAMLERVAERERDTLRLNEELEARVLDRTKELQLAATVVANTSEGVLVTDAKAQIISVNPAFSLITGYSAEEAVGRNPRLLKSDHHDAAFYRNLWQELLRTGRWRGDLWNRRKGGEAYVERLTINMIRGADGKPVNYVGVFSDVTESRRSDERMRQLAFHDPLTGLPNRFLLNDRLQHALGVARREQSRLALLFIDLDRFKEVNDTLGHDVGDLLLKSIAERLQSALRDVDTVARMGGDEFVALLENVEEPENCAAIAATLIDSLSQPLALGGHDVQVGASVGIAFYPEDGSDAQQLMKHADTAMYSAKRSGRGQIRFYRTAMTEQAERRLRLEVELRQAIAGDALEIVYQPKVCLAHGHVRGFEALLRWPHPERGLLLPADFLPLAEESTLIQELGRWTAEVVCRQAAEWQSRGIRLPIALDIPARQFAHGYLAELLGAACAKHNIRPDALEVEIAETTLMSPPETALRVLMPLREIGVGLTADEFGSGSSNLTQLRRLPIDTLKIDRALVMGAGRNEGDAQVVRAIVALARGLHLAVVAEGVETETQAKLLLGSGCDFAQGPLYARPMAAAVAEAWLAEVPGRLGPCTCKTAKRLHAV